MRKPAPQPSVWHRRIQKLGFIGLMLLLVNFTYQVWHRYFDKQAVQPGRNTCDLHKKPCTVLLPDKRKIEFAITPRQFSSDKPLEMTVKLTNFSPKRVYLTLTPEHKFEYSKEISLSEVKVGQYSAQVKLGDILTGQTAWVALVHIQAADQNIAVPFKF